MTDKEQIMIDGVDVSGCESIEHHSLNPITLATEFLSTPMCRAYQSKCEGRNCYFKQLSRKTQECEQQQKTLDELIGCVSIWEGFTEEESKLAKDSSIADLIMLLRKKTQECEQIKEKYEALKLENHEGYEIVAELKHECEELENKIKKLRKNLALEIEINDRYRKALEEIKELANGGKDMYIERGKYPDYEAMAKWMKNQFVFILDIINKAKGGDDE